MTMVNMVTKPEETKFKIILALRKTWIIKQKVMKPKVKKRKSRRQSRAWIRGLVCWGQLGSCNRGGARHTLLFCFSASLTSRLRGEDALLIRFTRLLYLLFRFFFCDVVTSLPFICHLFPAEISFSQWLSFIVSLATWEHAFDLFS